MTATASTGTANGKPPRRQLSEQLDRMDTIIDALAEALPEAVADACREGARQAVRDAVVEILASPDLRTLIAGPAAARVVPTTTDATPPADPAPSRPGPWTRFKAKIRAAADAALGRCRAALAAAAGRCRAATAAASATARTLSAVMPVRKFLAVG